MIYHSKSLIFFWIILLLFGLATAAAFSPPLPVTAPRRGHSNDKTSDKILAGTNNFRFQSVLNFKYFDSKVNSFKQDECDGSIGKFESSYIKALFRLMRPGNFPGVLLFHLIGIHLSLKSVNESTLRKVLSVSMCPSMIVTLCAILLVTASSMIVNDFYDAKNGVDMYKVIHANENHISEKPLVTGDLPLNVARDFLKLLYGSLLLLSAFVPSVGSRLLVMVATMITYCYTSYLKPIVWVKNISCAFLMAVSPLTSAIATTHQLSIPYSLLWPDLWLLIISLFFGFLGREMLMDINDFDADKRSGIETVPVKYGITSASIIVFGTWILSGIIVSTIPIVTLFQYIYKAKDFVFTKLIQEASFRQSLLAVSGAIMLSRSAFRVRNNEGVRKDINDIAIEDCKRALLFYLAAFI